MRRNIYDDDKRPFTVTLNDKPLEDVIWACEETGKAAIWEHEWALDIRGKRVIDCDTPNMARTLIVSGVIKITNGEVVEKPEANPYDYWSDQQIC